MREAHANGLLRARGQVLQDFANLIHVAEISPDVLWTHDAKIFNQISHTPFFLIS